MTRAERGGRTFDALQEADLEQVYLQGREEVLRSRAFRILLAHADSVAKLEKLAYGGERGLAGWTTEELLEISNRFRLLSSPENEIRLYRECNNPEFRRTARVREFYILALNRIGHPAEAIEAALDIVASGGQNALMWGMLGECYSARMIFAEQLASTLQIIDGNTAIALDTDSQQKLRHYFPEQDPQTLSLEVAEQLRHDNLTHAERIFQQGFRENASSYPGLGWMLRTVDVMAEQAKAFERQRSAAQLAAIDATARRLQAQAELVAVSLELQGGSESLDYWTHAGQAEVEVIRGMSMADLEVNLARACAAADAAFKFSIILKELTRLREQFECIRNILQPVRETPQLDAQLACADLAIAALNSGLSRFANRGDNSHSDSPQSPNPTQVTLPALTYLLKHTINFRAITGNLVPLYIEGSIGRIGARVPDLMINRRVREDLIDLLEDKVLRALSVEEREDPIAVIQRIQYVVGSELRLNELQDLQSPAHADFDARSDGLIALSGVDREMRKDSRTSTDLTAALLMQTGDCRETMYLNGALFACWQQMQASRYIATAILCLEFEYMSGFHRIMQQQLPALMRYQLRGGQASIFVEGIAMSAKYKCQQNGNGHAQLRRYDLATFRAGQPLTHYELEYSRLEVRYTDGTVLWLDPIDPITGRWQPIAHTPSALGGVPIIPNAENVHTLRLLNLVEEHAMTFLYDAKAQRMTLCDGFYNERLFDSPYPFANRPIQLEPQQQSVPGWFYVADRTLADEAGRIQAQPVYLSFLPFSHTDYAVGLVEGDIPGRLQLMGRTFQADFKLERRRIEEGRSAIPTLLADIQHWHVERNLHPPTEQVALDRQLARLMLDLAKSQPELIEFKEISAEQLLIQEACENDHVYLVLSGQLQIFRNEQPLLDADGNPRIVAAGGVVGEISALSGGPASATVRGNAVVLGISKASIQQQLDSHPVLRASMESLARTRVP